jgi:ParB family chromosome partitioning protein
MSNNTLQKVEKKQDASAASQSRLGSMLNGRINRSGNDAACKKPNTDFDSMLKSTAPEMKNSGELTFVNLDALLPFPNHPFKLYQGVKLNELVESIKEIGVVNAITIRKVHEQSGMYQILSGHNRANAARLAGLKQIKAEVIDVDDDTAALIVVDSNFKQREILLPSEKAFGFKMQLDALKRQGKRTDLSDDDNQAMKARDIIGKENDLSGFQISNYLRLTYLIPQLLEKVDDSSIPLRAGVVLSHIGKEKQTLLDKFITENRYKIDYEKALKLRVILCNEAFTDEALIKVFKEKTPLKNNFVKLSRKDLKKYFPEDLNTEEIIKRIYELLEKYSS